MQIDGAPEDIEASAHMGVQDLCVLKLEARAEGSGLGGEDLNTNRHRGLSTYVC